MKKKRTMTSPEVSVGDIESQSTVDIQWAVDPAVIDGAASLVELSNNDAMLTEWCIACAEFMDLSAFEVAIRIVDQEEITALNQRFRSRPNATNVLSFPHGTVDESGLLLLGDIVICATVLVTEAESQRKSVTAHFAHMLIHGLLHLQGLDHQADEQAEQMEAIEIQLMNRLGFDNPYDSTNSDQPNKIEKTLT
jgi:probable rRNA maturation factor